MHQKYLNRSAQIRFFCVGLLFLLIIARMPLPVLASTTALQPTDSAADPNTNEPQVLSDMTGAPQVSAGLVHSLLIHMDGRLFAFGDNSFGQLGTGIVGNSEEMLPVDLPERAAAVSAGAYHSLVLTENGNVYSFGRNAFGQLGTGTTENAALPQLIDTLPPAIAIAAGTYHSLVLAKDGSVWVFGSNTDGQSGPALSEAVQNEKRELIAKRVIRPQKIINSGIIAIAAGASHSLVLHSNGQVLAFGANSHGQLGDGTILSHSEPKIVPGISAATLIAAGSEHSMIVEVTKTVAGEKQTLLAFGDNSLGQIGVGSTFALDSAILSPTTVDWLTVAGKGIFQIKAIAAGYGNSLLIVERQDPVQPVLRNTQIMIWGSNAYGQIGDGGSASVALPRLLTADDQGHKGTSFLPIDDAAIGGGHVLLFSSRGLLGAAGRNDDGQLGAFSFQNALHFTGIPLPDLAEQVLIPQTDVMTVDATRVRAVNFGDQLNDGGFTIALQAPWDTSYAFGVNSTREPADLRASFFNGLAGLLVLIIILFTWHLQRRRRRRKILKAIPQKPIKPEPPKIRSVHAKLPMADTESTISDRYEKNSKK